MNKQFRIAFVFALVMVFAMSVTGYAQDDRPQGTPPTPEIVEEINSSRGAALLNYHPGYAVNVIPSTGRNFYFRRHAPPTTGQVEEITRTRGAALLDYWNK